MMQWLDIDTLFPNQFSSSLEHANSGPDNVFPCLKISSTIASSVRTNFV